MKYILPLLCLLSIATHHASAQDLAAYAGKYPDEETLPLPFLTNPLVKQGVERVVPDAQIRLRLLAPDGPKTPIWIAEGRIHSWGCEAHRCGAHNWMISMRPDGSAPEICYHNADSADVGTRWFAEGGNEVREYQCPSEGPE